MQEKPTELLKFALKLAKESGTILTRLQKKAKISHYKGKGDFCLDADMASEKHLMKSIQKKYPNHSILTEETGYHAHNAEYIWVVDPLEGTLNYAHHVPIWGVVIGLLHQNKPILGVAYFPELKELYHAVKGKGAYCNGKRIHVNNITDLEKSFIALGVVEFKHLELPRYIQRCYGCTGFELARIARGDLNAKLKMKGSDPYGWVGGSILVTEAGGKVTDLKGNNWHLLSQGAVASNGAIHQKLLGLFSNTY